MYQQECSYNYAICLKDDNYPIGYVNVDTHDSYDLGYGLRKEFWHKGIITEACRAVIEQLKKDGIPYIPLGAKNNDSHSEKWVIVKFYTEEYRKRGKFNSKNDSCPCMGASVILKSVDFTAFAVNVKNDNTHIYDIKRRPVPRILPTDGCFRGQ